MERKSLSIALLLLLAFIAYGEVLVGDFRLSPAALLVSSKNFTLTWRTSEPSTSEINCSGPGFELSPTQFEAEPTTSHSFFSNASFAKDGPFGCTIQTFPTNGSLVRSDFMSAVNCEGVRLELDSPSVRTAVYFTRPKGSGPYSVNATVKIRNGCVGRADVSASARPPPGISMKVEKFTLFGLDSYNVPVIITVPDSAGDGSYSGSVAFYAGGSTATETVNVTVHWPGPRLELVAKNLGNLKSGTNASTYVELKEALGYRAAQNVSCTVDFQDKAQPQQKDFLGTIQPFGSGRCKFSVMLPDKDVSIGDYSVYVGVESANAGRHLATVNYTVPAPYMLLAPKELLPLGKVTFEPGKDISYSLLTVIENGGFTPLEDIRFRLIEGEGDWVTLPDCDYAPPGGRANCTFRVMLSENANIGVKEWTIGVSAKNVSEIRLIARADVYFIGIEDALAELEKASNYSVTKKYTQAEMLKTETSGMLESIRGGKTGIQETAIVMSVHGGATSLLAQMEAAHNQFSDGDILEGGRSLLGAQMALERVSSSLRSAKVNDTTLLSRMGAVYSAGADFWGVASVGMLEKIESEADASENQNINYMKAAEYYSLLASLYRQNNTERSAEFSRKEIRMSTAYSDSIEKAGALKGNADRLFGLAREGTMQVGSLRLILNPFKYRETIDDYNRSLSDYEAAAGLFGSAGQQNELNQLLPKIRAVEGEFSFADFAFKAGTVMLSVLLAIGIMRVSVGMQRYREDEDDMETGDVMVR